ncbi:MAG: malic enzyme-like NAD(P)-binding protein, partial [Alphaproteobacteria bacterium]|nr:malic enzyme-like NAD(P)-binding protein [Alphaproteobacteria bacterium]
SEEMFLAAADALAGQVREKDLARGAIYPPLKDIRALSLAIAVAVAEVAYAQGLATIERPDDLEATIAAGMYDPYY